MRFALLGADQFAVECVRAIAQSSDHSLTAVCDVGTRFSAEIVSSEGTPRAQRIDNWESLLLAPNSPKLQVDAVLVAPGEDRELREEQLRRLAQQAVPLLVIHPACGPILGFELEMIRQDTGAVIAPYCLPLRHRGFLDLLRMSHDEVGAMQQVVFDRTILSPAASGDASSLSPQQRVLDQFVKDVALIRCLIGDITKISAMGAAAGKTDFANLSVHMTSHREALARWSVASRPDDEESSRIDASANASLAPSAKLTVIGAEGTAELWMDTGGRPWRLESKLIDDSPVEYEPQEQRRSSTAIVDSFAAAVRQTSAANNTLYDWSSACRDLELAEAIERSLDRGRTIELHLEEHSEESTFKGMMAVGGCGILMLALVVLVIAAVVGGFFLPTEPPALGEDMRPVESTGRWPVWLRIWPVYPILVFLILQFFRLVFRSPPQGDG